MQTFHPGNQVNLGQPELIDIPANPDHDTVRRWQAHVDAGRLGTRPATDPAVAANRAATNALFRSIARDRRALARENRA
ncbi:hypothetical protein GGQ80_001550 [Sphingomonas jinjuensis]|uniref:Uncharacterized protein n=1 Tax=Sphingomonas jinjuensis TaxID=535907 RepID=A0A840FD13_9SPHN|nr:hypothetical protein [Sphingomonas jinjuensis]MBB4153644.1 hypothetical protein [Sphingomonas jinjuensis]